MKEFTGSSISALLEQIDLESVEIDAAFPSSMQGLSATRFDPSHRFVENDDKQFVDNTLQLIEFDRTLVLTLRSRCPEDLDVVGVLHWLPTMVLMATDRIPLPSGETCRIEFRVETRTSAKLTISAFAREDRVASAG